MTTSIETPLTALLPQQIRLKDKQSQMNVGTIDQIGREEQKMSHSILCMI